jgi:ribosomal RNA-processing protein 12
LYHEPTLRPAILRGLKAIVEGNASLLEKDGPMNQANDEPPVEDGDDGESGPNPSENGKQALPVKGNAEYRPLVTIEQAKDNIAYLNSQAKSWLAVLFNVFTSMEKESRAMVGAVISVWAGISSEQVRSVGCLSGTHC